MPSHSLQEAQCGFEFVRGDTKVWSEKCASRWMIPSSVCLAACDQESRLAYKPGLLAGRYKYAGATDAIARSACGGLVVIDFKTSNSTSVLACAGCDGTVRHGRCCMVNG
eukprot:COSAG01_NODE_1079_length_11822_cov_4.368762_14_plen_110_part_00